MKIQASINSLQMAMSRLDVGLGGGGGSVDHFHSTTTQGLATNSTIHAGGVTGNKTNTRQMFSSEIWAMIIGFLDCQSLGRFDRAIDIRKCLSLPFFTSPALEQLSLHLLPLEWMKTRYVRLYKLQSVLLRSDDDDDDDDSSSSAVAPSKLYKPSIYGVLWFFNLSHLLTIEKKWIVILVHCRMLLCLRP